ncbi:MAG: MarC family protein [Alphaproteobacteria bacterium]|nr:MarC family protein [Alphaproteobacteria bacterium]
MMDSFLMAFAIFFAAVGPPDVAVVFAAITARHSLEERRRMALRATLAASAILLFFAFFGNSLLSYLGISLSALRIAGGILLFLIAIDMVFARMSGGSSATEQEQAEAVQRDDVAIFPMATPLIAGPGSIGSAILLVAEAQGEAMRILSVLSGLACVMLATFALMRLSIHVQRVLGATGANAIMRVLGILLAALAVQFILDGALPHFAG